MDGVTFVNMPVDQVRGLIAVHQRQKSLKSPVSDVLCVTVTCGGSVRQHNINTFGSVELPAESPDTTLHLLFRILIRPSVVHSRTAQPQNSKAVYDDELIINAVTSLGRT